MPRRRRAGLAIVAICLTSLATLVAAQAPDLPDCAVRCVTISATSSCNIDSYACVCRTLSGPVRSCITSICSGTTATSARDQFDLQCENFGVVIDGGATHTPTTSPSPSSPAPTSTKPPADTNTDTDTNSDTETENPPPNTGTRTPNDPADTAGTSTHSSSDVSSTGSSGAQPTASNPSDTNVTNPPNGANANGDQDSDGGGSSIGSLIGAIVGGLVGGLLVVALVWFILRRRRRQLLEDDDGVVAYGVPRSDNLSYLNEDKRDSSQPILMGHIPPSSHKYSASGSGFSPATSPHSSPAPAGFARPPGSTTSDSEGTYAARPFVANEADQQYIPRKGDPPRVVVYPNPSSSIAPESVAGSSSRSGGAGPVDPSSPIRGLDDSASVALTSASAQELTPEQLNLVQTMVNRGLPGAAVVDVIQRMLVDNQAVPPEYRPDAGGTLPPPMSPPPPITPGLPPPPMTLAPPASIGSGSTSRLPYRS